jgi:polar amino acid transport system substrate-binding protein
MVKRVRGWLRLLGVVTAWLAYLPPAAADTLDEIESRGELVWGADAEGGGPFLYPREDDPSRNQGFEVELAEYLAGKLGVKAEHRQGQWDKLPDLLRRGDIDIVLNGYEWRPAFEGRFGITLPYYTYELQVLVRKNDSRFSDLGDLSQSNGGKLRMAVLGGSAAETYVRDELGDSAQPIIFEGTTDAMRSVELGIDGVDATVQDLPIVEFYGERFPQLRRLGDPIAPGQYVILTRPDDAALVKALNQAILEGWQDGSIPRIYRKYKIWNKKQRERGLLLGAGGNYADDLPPEEPGGGPGPAGNHSRVADLLRRVPLLLQGAVVTVFLAVTSMPLAIIAGLGIALGRLYGPRWLRPALGFYVEVVRGTPLVLQLYLIFFLLPEIGISLPALVAAIVGLAINYSAYESEIYRAGLQAIPRGQMEAALSLGMSRRLALARIIVPQAFRLVIPPVMNDFIALFKDTAVCSVITVVELSKQYYMHAQSAAAVVELGIVTAALYLAMSYPLAIFVGHLEKRLAPERKED